MNMHFFSSKLSVIASVCATLLLVVGCETAMVKSPSPFVLTLLHNNDGESALLADDYSGSVAQFARVITDIRDELGADNTLIVSAGDNFLAGVEYAASQGRFDARALNLSGIEASAIGNHEFDFGPEGLERFLEEADFTFVSSNLDFSHEPGLNRFVGEKIFPYAIIEKAGNSIGLIGATTEQISYISSPGKVIINDVKTALQEAADTLTEKGIRVIIALTHLQNVDEEKALAQSINGVDIFVAGGGDNLLGNASNSYLVRQDRDGNDVVDSPEEPYPFVTTSPAGEPVVVVATDGSYNYVGRLVVSFDEDGLVQSVDDTLSGPIAITPDLPSDATIEREILDEVQGIIDSFAEDVVGIAANGLDGTRGLVRTQETTMGNAISDSYLTVARETHDVDFAFTNGGGIRRSIIIPAGGEVTMSDVLTALPFTNFLTVVEGLTVEQIKAIFEHSVAELPEAGGRFLQVAGIEVMYDSSAPVGDRVHTLTIDDMVIFDDVTSVSGTFNAVTNSFVADGGDGYEVLDAVAADDKINIGYSYSQAFEQYLRVKKNLTVDIEGRLVDTAR